MIITKEQQEAWVSQYVKGKHNADECIGFIDGIKKALDTVQDIAPDKEKAKRLLQDWYFCIAGNDEKHPQVLAIRKCMNDLEVIFGITREDKDNLRIG